MEPSAGSRSSIDQGGPLLAAGEPGAIALGRVVGAHGLRGGIRVHYFAEGPENLLAVRSAAIRRTDLDPESTTYEVRSIAAGRPGELRLELVGVRTREAALALKGRLVFVAPDELRALGPGEYYGYQLLGCRVEGLDGAPIGTLREIWETGASDLFVVEDERGARHLLPAALLRRVDDGERRIAMEILPGLLDGK